MNELVQDKKLKRKDFESDQEPRWCLGCGDYAILAQMKKVLPEMGIPKERIVFVSGIGCSSRFPYYMDTYGIHGIHGRAPAIATGIKIANPELNVFVITGDGDGLSIGGNHLMHLCRRNVDVTVILFNNQIYGLTKGQYSPTSNQGLVTKSSPYGSIETPFNPIRLALAAGATFVARSIDRETKHLAEILRLAAEHKGTSFVEVYQNCHIFNDGAFADLTDADQKQDQLLVMEQDRPYTFGKKGDRALDWRNNHLEVVSVNGNGSSDALIRHNAYLADEALEFMLAGMSEKPNFPTPIGVFRQIKADAYEQLLNRQIEFIKEKKGEGELQALLDSGYTWTVE